MAILNCRKILQEQNASDRCAITSINLTHRALGDVSCLSEFKNLEKLELGFNNLTSLESLMLCVNLKWLSVVSNNLHSLKGIEGLSKLTVLNAGKNKLKSMNEVETLTSLRALILNDNEMTSVCKLHHMKELNTLVLSRNPISSLGESLMKLKSIAKLSLSNCKLVSVDLPFKSCLELKELRLAHNEITSIPDGFRCLVKLHILDMGNNLITSWSSVKVLSSLANLKNLNLQGNPIAERDDLLYKVEKLFPCLQIFNARQMDKLSKKEQHQKSTEPRVQRSSDTPLDAPPAAENTKIPTRKKKSKRRDESESVEKKSRKQLAADVIDSADSPFTDLFTSPHPEVVSLPEKTADDGDEPKTNRSKTGPPSRPTRIESKKENGNRRNAAAAEMLMQADEIGLGGSSAWE